MTTPMMIDPAQLPATIRAYLDDRWVAVNRLEGDFPGGAVELRYRFALVDDLISELVIAP